MSKYMLSISQPSRLSPLLQTAATQGELSLSMVAETVGFRVPTAQPYAELLVEAGLLQRMSLPIGRSADSIYLVTDDALRIAALPQRDEEAILFSIAYRLPLFRRFADMRLLYCLVALFLQHPNKRDWVYELLLMTPALGAIADPFLAACTDKRGQIHDDSFATALSFNWNATLLAHGLPPVEQPFALEDRFRQWEDALNIPRSDHVVVARTWLGLWRTVADLPVYVPRGLVPAGDTNLDIDKQLDIFLSMLVANTHREEGMYLSLPHATRHLQTDDAGLTGLLDRWRALGAPIFCQRGAAALLRPVRLGDVPDVAGRWDAVQQLGLLDQGHPRLDVMAETFSGASSVGSPVQLTPIMRSFLLDLKARVAGEDGASFPIMLPPALMDISSAAQDDPTSVFQDGACAFVYGLPPSDEIRQRRHLESLDYADHRHRLVQHLPYVLLLLLLAEHAWDREGAAYCWLHAGRGSVVIRARDHEALAEQVLPLLLHRLGYRPFPDPDVHEAFKVGWKLGFWRKDGQLYQRYGGALNQVSADWWDDNAGLRDQLAQQAARMVRGNEHE